MSLQFQIDLLEIQYDAKILLAELMSVIKPVIYYKELINLQRKLEKLIHEYKWRDEFVPIRDLIDQCVDEIHSPYHMNEYRREKLMNLQIDASICDIMKIYLIDVQNKTYNPKDYYTYILRLTLENIYPKLRDCDVDYLIETYEGFFDNKTE